MYLYRVNIIVASQQEERTRLLSAAVTACKTTAICSLVLFKLEKLRLNLFYEFWTTS